MPTERSTTADSAAATAIREFALAGGAWAAGIASAAAVDAQAPEGHRPSDILKGARSVIVLGCPTALAGGFHTPFPRVLGLNIKTLREQSARLADMIERRYGHYCIAETNAMSGFNPMLSLKLCAEMAGLGTRSMAGGTILHPEYGLLMLGAVITTMPLPADGPLAEPVCPHPSCVSLWEQKRTLPCLDACPDCLSGALENGRIGQLHYNRHLCTTRAQVTGSRAFQKMLLAILEEPDPDRRKMMVLGSYFSRIVDGMALTRAVVAQCHACILACPVGRSYRHPRPVEVGLAAGEPEYDAGGERA